MVLDYQVDRISPVDLIRQAPGSTSPGTTGEISLREKRAITEMVEMCGTKHRCAKHKVLRMLVLLETAGIIGHQTRREAVIYRQLRIDVGLIWEEMLGVMRADRLVTVAVQSLIRVGMNLVRPLRAARIAGRRVNGAQADLIPELDEESLLCPRLSQRRPRRRFKFPRLTPSAHGSSRPTGPRISSTSTRPGRPS